MLRLQDIHRAAKEFELLRFSFASARIFFSDDEPVVAPTTEGKPNSHAVLLC
jgi:hypothetical protein